MESVGERQGSLAETLEELDRIAPNAPLLALGQTVFWDEPMKGGVALLAPHRRFVAGVHDTDYFAKLPGGSSGRPAYRAFPHNDTTTKGLWSAAAEFSSLFGSETVVSRDFLMRHGARLHKVSRARSGWIDAMTEAHGWRGVVALGDPPISAEVPLAGLLPTLRETFAWALEETRLAVCEPERLLATESIQRLLHLFDEVASRHRTLGAFYRELLPHLYEFAAGEPVELEPTTTTELLKFNLSTYSQPRFDLVDAFLQPETRDLARNAYDEAVYGSEIYPLHRFQSGAIPFDLYVPGHGRGTLRIGNHALIVMTPKPLFVDLKSPIQSVRDLAQVVEDRFGPDCTLIGKAVTLIGMLAREFVFVFHEGASSYVTLSRRLHEQLAAGGHALHLHPILRVRYHAWDSLAECHAWLKLPEPLHRPFGTEELCTPSFAARWKDVAEEQSKRILELGRLRRPIDLIQNLRDTASPSWKCLATEYQSLHERLETLESQLNELRRQRYEAYAELRRLRLLRIEQERAKGEHFRRHLFEQTPTPEALADRASRTEEIEATIHAIAKVEQRVRDLLHRQRELARDPEVVRVHDRRRTIELEAEMKRIRLLRYARIATVGLQRAQLRPSAWWFPLLCPDGGWFRRTLQTAEAYLEPLQ